MEDLYSKNGWVHTYVFTFSPNSPEYVHKYGQKIHLSYYCTPRLQPESLTRLSLSPILPKRLCLRYKKRNQKTAKKEKRVEKQRAKGGNKKGEREQRLPLHQMNEIVSELLLSAPYPSNPHKQSINSSRQQIIKYVLVNSYTGGKT